MKKKMIATMLVAAIALGTAACGSSTDYSAALQGSWNRVDAIDADEWKGLLTAMDFYESEIAYADLSGAAFVETTTFNEDKTYTIMENEEASIASITATLTDFLTTIYENRSSIEEYSGYFDDAASADEFIESYATALWNYDSADAMLADMASYVYSQYTFSEEKGEYKVDKSQIGFKEEGDSDYAYADYTLDGDNLTIVYSNVTANYTR